MPPRFDVTAIGNAIVDVIAPAEETFLAREGLAKGAMTLIDEARGRELYERMAPGVEASGGAAANTVAGVASLGGRAAFIGKVADDQLGDVFAHDMKSAGGHFESPRLVGSAATARCLINVTPDGERTMCTYLGACVELTADDVSPPLVEGAKILYLEGYLFDPPEARRAFAKAAGLARGAGVRIAMTLSDAFVVERHRAALWDFVHGQVDILFANETEILALTRCAGFEDALDAVADRVEIAAITRGAYGSVVLAQGARRDIPVVPPAKVLDTTGAGDQYAAGFLFGLASGRSLEACGALGSLAASEVISHYGPRAQTSLRALVEAARL